MSFDQVEELPSQWCFDSRGKRALEVNDFPFSALLLVGFLTFWGERELVVVAAFLQRGLVVVLHEVEVRLALRQSSQSFVNHGRYLLLDVIGVVE